MPANGRRDLIRRLKFKTGYQSAGTNGEASKKTEVIGKTTITTETYTIEGLSEDI